MNTRDQWSRRSRRSAPKSSGAILHFAAFFLASCVSTSIAPGDDSARSTPTAIAPAPIQDDANLHDIQFVNERVGWAVGDHGVIWRTEDGGLTWQLLPCPADCALQSVCFLSDRVGWIVGGATMPFTQLGVGIVLGTTDGGRTWTEFGRGRLPQLQSVRFFSLTEGVLVGEATAEFPTGVITTRDGGKTWQAVEGGRHSGWRAADFLSLEVGITAGLDGTVARFDGKLVDVRAGSFGPRGLYGAKLSGDDCGWIVGDGALVLRTTNRGVVWQSPPTPLPEEAADLFNFRTVAVRGEKLWIAGSPGSVVWHSSDGGQKWMTQQTAQTAPIERLFFHSDQIGWAVGVFGNILRTDDGGASWRVLRGGNRRAALLSLHARTGEISFNLLAKQAAELGYRSVALVPFRGTDAGDAALPPDFDLRLHDAVTSAGGSHGSIGWQFPLEIPGLDRDAEKLIAEWMLRTEGRFQQAFYGNLVCQIRTWRPTVIVIDQPSPGDAAGNVLVNAVVDAVRQAADPACFAAHHNLAGLAPWKASRIFARLPPGSSGDLLIDSNERLPRLRSTVTTVATWASSRLAPVDAEAPETEAFRLVRSAAEAGRAEARELAPADFFTGVSIGPDARRELSAVNTEVDERSLRLAQRDRNFRAILKQRAKAASHGAELIAMLRSSTRGADRATAALQLATLADAYRRNGQWELTEAALVELVEHYPNEAASFEAMRWLLQYWTGAELTYQRLRTETAESGRLQFNPAAVGETIQKAVALAQTEPATREPIDNVSGQDPLHFVSRPSHLRVSANGDWLDLKLKEQRTRALQMATLIRRRSPTLFRSPEVQLPLASLLKQSGMTALPAEKSSLSPSGAKSGSVAGEASPAFYQPTQKIVKCGVATERPKLNGLLSDACWQQAVEIPLSPDSAPPAGDAPHAFALLAHDAQYLYFAVSVPRAGGVRKDGVVGLGRTHDQDLSPFDRVALCFDVDRDFVSWYTIEIDQRGCVAESCWGDSSWNPTMYIAADADEDHWRIEGAIPFSELVPRAPQAGEGWGLAVLRTIPAVRLESWSHPAAVRPAPESFGVLRFQ
jgi:photosystem II stability/assembly factor-like uncharacterized protein